MKRILILTSLTVPFTCLAEEAKTKIVAVSPNKNFHITTKAQHTLVVTKNGTRRVGSGAEGPDEVLVKCAKDGATLLEVVGGVEGPVEAHWNKDSDYVILNWHGYRYNWTRILVKTKGKPQIIDLKTSGLHKIIRHDPRPVWEREAQTYKGEPDTSPPFEKKKWLLTPIRWLADSKILISVMELSRGGQDSHPFEQNVAWYTIKTEITDKGFRPLSLYASADLDCKKPLWTRKAEQDGADQPSTAPKSKPESDAKPKPESERSQ